MSKPHHGSALIVRTVLTICAASLGLSLSQSSALAQQSTLQKPSFETDKSLKKLKLSAFVPQVGHSRSISDMAFSPDGKLLVSASGLDDGLVKVWDTQTGALLHTLAGEDYVSFSADGKLLATGNVGGPVLIWDVITGKVLHTLNGSGPLAFSGDGKVLVTEGMGKDGANGKLQLWSLPGFEAQPAIEGHKASWTSLSLSVDGRFAATGSYDETIKVWDLKTKELARTFKAHAWVPQVVALSPDAEQLAVSYSGEKKTMVELWDVSASKVERTLKGHDKDITSMAFSPDGTRLATAGLDKKLRFWDVKAGKLTGEEPGGGIVRYSPNSQIIAHGAQSILLSKLNPEGEYKRVILEANDTSMFEVVFGPSAKKFITSDAVRTLDHWDTSGGRLLQSVIIPNGTVDEPIGELILSPQGTMAALRPFSGTTLKIFDASTANVIHTIEVPSASAVRNVSFSPNEAELIIESVAANDDELTQFTWWDLQTKAALSKTNIEGYVRVQGFVDDGKNVALVSHGSASGAARLSIKIWERDSGLLKSVKVKDVPPYAGDVSFCQNSPYIALGDQDYTIKLFDRTKDAITATLSKHDELVNTIVCSQDGKLLVTSSWDEQVKLWSLPEGKLLMTIDDAHYKAQNISISADGKQLIIAHKGWVRHLHIPSGHWRTFYRVGKNGWLGHDSHGRFDCVEEGCKLATYRDQKSTTLKRAADDKTLSKGLRGLAPLK